MKRNGFLLTAIMATSILFSTSCVKNEVSDEVKALRQEQLEQAKAKTAKDKLDAQIKKISVAKSELELKKAELAHEINMLELKKQINMLGLTHAQEYLTNYKNAVATLITLKKQLMEDTKTLAEKEAVLTAIKGDKTNLEKIAKLTVEAKKTDVEKAEEALKMAETTLENYKVAAQSPNDVQAQIDALNVELNSLENEQQGKNKDIAILMEKKDSMEQVVKNFEDNISGYEEFQKDLKNKEKQLENFTLERIKSEKKLETLIADTVEYNKLITDSEKKIKESKKVKDEKNRAYEIARTKLRIAFNNFVGGEETHTAKAGAPSGLIPSAYVVSNPNYWAAVEATDPENWIEMTGTFAPTDPAKPFEKAPLASTWDNAYNTMQDAATQLASAEKTYNKHVSNKNEAERLSKETVSQIKFVNIHLAQAKSKEFEKKVEVDGLKAQIEATKELYKKAKENIEQAIKDAIQPNIDVLVKQREISLLGVKISSIDKQISALETIKSNLDASTGLIASAKADIATCKTTLANAIEALKDAKATAAQKDYTVFLAAAEKDVNEYKEKVKIGEEKIKAQEVIVNGWKAKLEAAIAGN